MTMTALTQNLPFPAYLALPHWSQSSIKAMRQSPAHALHARDYGMKTATEAMLLGSALHVAFLEPELLLTKVVLWDKGTRKKGVKKDGGAIAGTMNSDGISWNDFSHIHEDKIILTAGLYNSLIGMIRSMRAHPFVREWSGKIEAVEVSAIGDVFGLTVKGRADALTDDPLIDIKKVRSADPRAIANAVIEYGYDIQAHVYHTLFNRSRHVLLCVEDTEPFDVVPYELSPAFLGRGARETQRFIEQIHECEASGVWTGRSAVAVELDPPSWSVEPAKPITIGGKPLGLPVESDPMGLEVAS